MTPVPSPLPPAVAGLLHESSSLNTRLDHVGTQIGKALVGVPGYHMAPVSAVHGPDVLPVGASAALALCTIPACVWCLRRRRYLRQSARGLVSPRCWREGWRWHSHVGKVKNLRGNRPGPKSIARWPTRAGVTHLLALKGGMNLKMLEELVPDMAADLSVMDLTFERIYRNQGQALAHIGRRDSLAETFPWPWLDRETTDFLGPIPAGVDRNGKPVTIDLREKHLLVGGGTGSGKSWWLHTIVAAAMGDVRVRNHMLDGKMGSGFAVWEDAFDSFATNDVDDQREAMAIVKRLEAKVNRIYAQFRSAKERTVDWSTVKEVDVLYMDEFTAFLPIPGMAKALANLLARARAAGTILVLTTQRPSSKIIDTDFRELFPYRAALLSDKAGSKMILGDGVEADSSEFSGLNPGEMYLLHEGRQPVRCRGYSLTDSNLADLAARATALRSNQDRPNPDDDQETPPAPFSTSLSNGSTGGHADLPGEAPNLPQETRKPLDRYQRATLEALSARGEPVTVRELADALGEPDYEIRRRLNRLERLGLVAGARRARPPGEGEGAREPKLWSVTGTGVEELLRAAEREHEEAAV